MRLPADERRRQLLDVACELFARSRLPRHVDGRHRGSRGRHQARAVPALPEQARALRASCSRTPAAPARRASPRRPSRATSGRERVEAGLPRLLPVRGRRPFGVPAAVRRVDPQRSRFRPHGRRHPARRRRHDLARSSRSRPPTSSAACSRTRSSAWPSRSGGARCVRRGDDVDGDELAAWIAELAWFGLRGVRADEPPTPEAQSGQNLRSRTRRTRWSAPFSSTRFARSRLGAMFSRRFARLISRHTDGAELPRVVLRGRRVRKLKYERGSMQRRLAQQQQPRDVPLLEILLARVDVDREVEEVGHDEARVGAPAPRRRLQHVHALDDHDVGAARARSRRPRRCRR